jgi:hypothetical protein
LADGWLPVLGRSASATVGWLRVRVSVPLDRVRV